LFELVQRERHNADNRVAPFKSIFLEIGTHGSAMTSSSAYQQPLPELAQWWYSTCLGLRDLPVANRPLQVLQLACNHRPRRHGVEEIKVRLTSSIRDSSEVSAIMDMIQDE
jgi:hypothetical protein